MHMWEKMGILLTITTLPNIFLHCIFLLLCLILFLTSFLLFGVSALFWFCHPVLSYFSSTYSLRQLFCFDIAEFIFHLGNKISVPRIINPIIRSARWKCHGDAFVFFHHEEIYHLNSSPDQYEYDQQWFNVFTVTSCPRTLMRSWRGWRRIWRRLSSISIPAAPTRIQMIQFVLFQLYSPTILLCLSISNIRFE